MVDPPTLRIRFSERIERTGLSGITLACSLLTVKYCLSASKAAAAAFAAAAAEGIARQPEAADKISGAVQLPLFLLEGVAILAEVFIFLMLIL